jgi:hypothetical protein
VEEVSVLSRLAEIQELIAVAPALNQRLASREIDSTLEILRNQISAPTRVQSKRGRPRADVTEHVIRHTNRRCALCREIGHNRSTCSSNRNV